MRKISLINTDPYPLFMCSTGSINPKAQEATNEYLTINYDKINSIINSIPKFERNNIMLYDINYIYKNIFAFSGNINNIYLQRLCDSINEKTVIIKQEAPYNKYTDKAYIKTNYYVSSKVINLIMEDKYKLPQGKICEYYEEFVVYLYDMNYSDNQYHTSKSGKNDMSCFDKYRNNAQSYIDCIEMINIFQSNIKKEIIK